LCISLIFSYIIFGQKCRAPLKLTELLRLCFKQIKVVCSNEFYTISTKHVVATGAEKKHGNRRPQCDSSSHTDPEGFTPLYRARPKRPSAQLPAYCVKMGIDHVTGTDWVV